ncbi:MAG: helix-turn-helix domain-containing protein [Ruminococcus sp.]|jgi:transcriptional regulator with XRE-family HTH domain|nr:helix-turn-helix domain-containing protein [Ruminococcus sp.]
MTFAEKLRRCRLVLNLSQTELARRSGITERTIYTYESMGIMPRSGNVKKLADSLGVSVSYLLEDDRNVVSTPFEDESIDDVNAEIYLLAVQDKFGENGLAEAKELLSRTALLFAATDIEEEAKDIFFQSLMEVYLESKAEARDKFIPRKRKSRTIKV